MKVLDNVVQSVESFCSKLTDGLRSKQLDVLLLDVSGSMEDNDYLPSRLGGAKQASIAFLGRVAESNPEGNIAVLSFADSAKIAAKPMPVKEKMLRLEEAINDLVTDGSTNMVAGLKLSQKVIKQSINPLNPRILMLTDGHSNSGGAPLAIAEELKQAGVQIDIVGIGGSPSDVDEVSLRQMASVVNDELHYWFIKDVPSLVRRFETLAIREIK